MAPNLRANHVKGAFGTAANYTKIVKKITDCGKDVVFKIRKKQWFPADIKKYVKEIVEDGTTMYPPITSDLFRRCGMTVMLGSSGIYECVYGGQFVLNIDFATEWIPRDKKKLREYFSTKEGNPYQFKDVVETIPQSTVLADSWKFVPRKVDPARRKEWINKYIGIDPADGAKAIAMDIIND
jgi:hypothetical protein